MIKHILKIIWNQRRNNSWIFMELLLVAAVLWIMIDSMLMTIYTYYSPLGFDITNVYKVNIGKITSDIEGYVPDSLHTTSDGEDLIRLVDNLRQTPEVDETCLAVVACPYTWSNAWSSLIQADADTTQVADMYQYFCVTPSYFDVLRFKDPEGHALHPIVEESTGNIVITADMEKKFFNGKSGKGQFVKSNAKDSKTFTVAAISAPIRQTEYKKSEPCYYYLLKNDQDIVEYVSFQRVQNMDCLIRMKEGFRGEDVESFLQNMSDRLTVNNLYVSSVVSLEEMRPVILKEHTDMIKKKVALVCFMLVNVFFGIIGTFWLRTQYRRGELGVRVAMGASRSHLKRFMDAEGLCMLAFTLPVVLCFIANMLYFDMPDTYRLPYTWWRLLITLGGTILLLGSMILMGIWFPTRKIVNMNPADALHYE